MVWILSGWPHQSHRRQQLLSRPAHGLHRSQRRGSGGQQIETYPFDQQIATRQFLRENNVQIKAWGPFAEDKNNIFHNDVLLSIAGRYGKSVAQVILRWLTQRGVIAIPKSVRKERMAENVKVFDFELSAEDMHAIATLDSKHSAFFDHRDPAMVKALGTRKIHD